MNEYKKGIVDGSWLQHQCRRMIERNMNYMKSNKMDEGQEAESLKAVPSGSSNDAEASCKCTKSRGGGISGNKRTKSCQRCSASQLKKKRSKMNLAKLLDWSRKAEKSKTAVSRKIPQPKGNVIPQNSPAASGGTSPLILFIRVYIYAV